MIIRVFSSPVSLKQALQVAKLKQQHPQTFLEFVGSQRKRRPRMPRAARCRWGTGQVALDFQA